MPSLRRFGANSSNWASSTWPLLPERRSRTALPLAARAPYFCSGCPHNSSTPVPEGTLVGAGIGCHAMVLIMARAGREAVGLTQMGGEGAQWLGMAPFVEQRHFSRTR